MRIGDTGVRHGDDIKVIEKRSMTDRGGMRLGWRLAAATAVAVVAGGVIWGFLAGRAERAQDAPAPDEEAVTEPQRVTVVDGAPVITLDVATQKISGLETAPLKAIAYVQQLRAYGTVLDLQKLTDLSNSYVTAQAARQTAEAKLAASKPAFERAERLYRDHQSVSAAQVQSAEAAFRIDEAGVAAADSQLRTLTATAQQAWGTALAQALVSRAPMFLRLIDRQDVLLQVTLPPGVFVTKPPTSAFVELPDGTRASLHFVSPATRTDPHIQGVSFFYTAPSQTGLLPGMSVLVFLPSDTPVHGVVVPSSAIVWWQGRAWIYIKSGTDRFARRAVATDIPAADGSYVVADMVAGGDVVVQGAQMLLSEELRGEIRASDD